MNAGSMIADSANVFLTRAGGVGRVRKQRDSGALLDRDAWQEMARLGWFGLLIGEEAGGLGLAGRDLAELMETLGRYLATEPVAEAIATGAAIASAEPSNRLLEAIISGAAIVVPVEGQVSVSGRVVGMFDATANLAAATHALITAEADGQFVLVSLDAPGVELETRATVDGGSISILRLDMRREDAIVLPKSNTAARDPQAVRRLAQAAYLVGLADAAFAIAIDYLKTRKQFGVPIGTFQALQHRAATAYVRIASVRALVDEAAADLDADRFSAATAAAAFAASEMALAVTKECIQFHGAVGFADEHQIGLFLKRALAVAGSIGTGDECLDRYFYASRNTNDSNNISTAA